jgi:hypothetical protein
MRHGTSLRAWAASASIGVALGTAGVAAAGTVNFSDQTFADVDWQATLVQFDAGGSFAAVQANDPVQGAFRQITQTVNTASGPAASSTIYTIHINPAATYDPEGGAINSVDYSELAILLDGFNQGQAGGAALRQGGRLYVSSASFITPDFAWTPKATPGLTAASFAPLDDPTAHPDFSQAGGPIEFGFFRANSTAPGGTTYFTVGGIDDYALTLNTADVTEPPPPPTGIPLPPAVWAGLTTLGGAWLTAAVRRRVARR